MCGGGDLTTEHPAGRCYDAVAYGKCHTKAIATFKSEVLTCGEDTVPEVIDCVAAVAQTAAGKASPSLLKCLYAPYFSETCQARARDKWMRARKRCDVGTQG